MAVAALVAVLGACAGPATDPARPPSILHPLEGRIWDARTGAFISEGDVLAEALSADVVLLGEIHVNRQHHRLQAWIIDQLADASAGPAVVMEMLEVDRQPDIDAVLAGSRPKAEAVADATGFRDSGWDWDMYGPLIRTTLRRDLPLLAGNAPRTTVRDLARGDSGVLGDDERARLGLDEPLADPAYEALRTELVEGHCGHLPASMEDGLVDAQRLRDATMADVIAGVRPRSVVLIAGSGHVRRDYGVPRYLEARQADSRMLVVSFTEVYHGEEGPAAYLPLTADEPVFDILWFTERVEREDPCEAFREQLEQMQQAHQSAD